MSEVNWQALRAEYEAGGLSLRQLAAKYGVSKTYLIERRNNEHWNRPDRPPVIQQSTPTDRRKPPTQRVERPHSHPPTRDVNAAMRVQQALRLYLEERPTWEEIAARSGYSSKGAAHDAVMRELHRCITHDVKQLRDEELYRIEQLQARCYKEATDKGNNYWTFAVDRFVSLSKRKAELMGMDTPVDSAALANVTIIREVPVGFLAPVQRAEVGS